jgi:phage shock protein A
MLNNVHFVLHGDMNTVHNGECKMFKQFLTLFKGHAVTSAEQVLDSNALVVLRQQIRESATSVQSARNALALAVAQNQAEADHGAKLAAQIADLETRAIAAMTQDKTELANEAATMIAGLESDHAASLQAQKNFANEINRQKKIVRQAESRVQELERGLRLAHVTDKTQRLTTGMPSHGLSNLKDAEMTLARLKSRQLETDRTQAALLDMDSELSPEALAARMADAACGPSIKTSADDVLKRLAARAKNAA